MEYRSVGDRCAVDLSALSLPCSDIDALTILSTLGLCAIDVDLLSLARSCIGSSVYCRGARPREAPSVVDCSSFVKWLYGQRGIWLPRRSIQQRTLGAKILCDDIRCGDLVFVSGWIDWFFDDPADGVGHVGIATGEGSVIHAKNRRQGVIETPLADFITEDRFRGARRIIPTDREIRTLCIPDTIDVETADDLRWIILRTFPEI